MMFELIAAAWLGVVGLFFLATYFNYGKHVVFNAVGDFLIKFSILKRTKTVILSYALFTLLLSFMAGAKLAAPYVFPELKEIEDKNRQIDEALKREAQFHPSSGGTSPSSPPTCASKKRKRIERYRQKSVISSKDEEETATSISRAEEDRARARQKDAGE